MGYVKCFDWCRCGETADATARQCSFPVDELGIFDVNEQVVMTQKISADDGFFSVGDDEIPDKWAT